MSQGRDGSQTCTSDAPWLVGNNGLWSPSSPPSSSSAAPTSVGSARGSVAPASPPPQIADGIPSPPESYVRINPTPVRAPVKADKRRDGTEKLNGMTGDDAPPRSSTTAVADWVPCEHSDPPARYRDTPAFYCTYCSYTVCEGCYDLISTELHPSEQHPQQNQRRQQQQQQCVSVDMSWLDDVLSLPSTAVRSGATAAGDNNDSVEAGSVAAAAATAQLLAHSKEDERGQPNNSGQRSVPPLCHLCRRGHLLREEALLHEWCCEGPAPANRLSRGHALVYDTQNLQKYHFMRAQHDSRLASTAPLQAVMLSATPAELQPRNPDSTDQHHTRQPLFELRQTRVRKDPLPATSAATPQQQQPRRKQQQHGEFPPVSASAEAAAAATTASHGPSTRSRSDTCEEGGSFVFAVRNPRLETTLVWCAVNQQPREESAAYAGAAANFTGSQRLGQTCVGRVSGSSSSRTGQPSTSSATPLLLWKCPPSLPGLPARPYRVCIPYGLYAFANVHALSLYVASDIFRKATTQLVGLAASTTNSSSSSGFGLPAGGALMDDVVAGPVRHLASLAVTPAASLRPLLTVTVLHHVATTPRPLSFPPSQRALLKRLRTPDTVPTLSAKETEPEEKRAKAEPASIAPSQQLRETVTEEPGKLKQGKGEAAAATAPQLTWPAGLSSVELTLCVDHLLHGRSVAVYGIASKFFFLQHVASSAELQSFEVVTVDASLGRASAQAYSGIGSGVATDNVGSEGWGGSRRRTSAPSGAGGNSNSSVLRQLTSLGDALARRVAAPRVLTAERRAAMTAAVAAVSTKEEEKEEEQRAEKHAQAVGEGSSRGKEKPLSGKTKQPHRTALKFGDTSEEDNDDGDADIGGGVARAALQGDVGRSPAMARDVTAAMLRAVSAPEHGAPQRQRQQEKQGFFSTMVVVDVDSSSFSNTATRRADSSSVSAPDEAQPAGSPGDMSKHEGVVTPAKGAVRKTPPDVAAAPLTSLLVSPVEKRSSHAHALAGHTPVSQQAANLNRALGSSGSSGSAHKERRGALAQLSHGGTATPPPVLSPVPAFFEALQHTVNGEDSRNSSSSNDNDNSKQNDVSGATTAASISQAVTCEELPEYFGEPSSLQLPPWKQNTDQRLETCTTTATAAALEVSWRPPLVKYASDAVRRHVMQMLRRQHAARRCVQWASLPSTSAVTQLQEQLQTRPVDVDKIKNKDDDDGKFTNAASFFVSPALRHTLLTAAHATRPGWQPPVLLVLHNADLLDGDEVHVFLQLCARFAFPQPHLQLLLSFDDPLWPLGPVAAALERLGVCAVQLRSLLLPRVHEMRHVSSIHLLTDFEAATAAAAGRNGSSGGGNGRGGKGRGKAGRGGFGSALAAAAAAAKGVGSAAVAAAAARSGGGGGGAGTSHLLQDTMHRVLCSLPQAFNGLLRILLDVQDEVGEGVYVSLFTVTERFEKAGVMVSQGRLKALLRELTSNRIARYDSAEHALTVPQVARLRKVLDEVTAQREGGAGGKVVAP